MTRGVRCVRARAVEDCEQKVRRVGTDCALVPGEDVVERAREVWIIAIEL